MQMTAVHARIAEREAILSREDFDRLMELARASDEVELRAETDDVPVLGIMNLAEEGGAFDFLSQDEDVYTVDDLKVRYR